MDEKRSLERIAKALERIADALEKKRRGNTGQNEPGSKIINTEAELVREWLLSLDKYDVNKFYMRELVPRDV